MRIEKPKRVSRSYTQQLCAPPGEVFPLLCPVRETEWVNDWHPRLVISESGRAEPGCIFVTPGVPQDAVWLMTGYDAERFRLEIVKVIPEIVIGTIRVELTAAGEAACTADITYSYTSLSREGDLALDQFTADHFDAFMRTWEAELNHFLEHGSKLDLAQKPMA